MWRFIHLSDPHLASQRDGRWNNGFLCSMMPDVMRCLRHDLPQWGADFILATGDIASHQTRDAVFAARDLMDSLQIPYYPMGGNHDFVLPESREWFIEAFGAHLPQQDTVYSFTHENLHFCVLDAWWKWHDDSLCQVSERTVAEKMDVSLVGARWAIPPHQFAWLQHELEQHASTPCIIAVHYPAIPIPQRLVRPGIKDAGHLDNGDTLLAFLTHFPQVRAIFSGHLHMHFIEEVNGITQVVTGALPEYPTEYRIIDVHKDRLSISTHRLSDASFADQSLIPGKEWVAGEPCDRQREIRLTW